MGAWEPQSSAKCQAEITDKAEAAAAAAAHRHRVEATTITIATEAGAGAGAGVRRLHTRDVVETTALAPRGSRWEDDSGPRKHGSSRSSRFDDREDAGSSWGSSRGGDSRRGGRDHGDDANANPNTTAVLHTASADKFVFDASQIAPADGTGASGEAEKSVVQPNFALSGALAAETNTFNGVVLKYAEPLEARKPKKQWRLYPFKGEQSLDVIPLHTQSAYMFGRDRQVADIPLDHPSCSKQHAVIQYRQMPHERPDGTQVLRVKPYLIDLDSANGTTLNGKRIDPRRYYELLLKDSICFGLSSREYVLLHDQATEDAD
ncbi:smad nuclear interacting protein 1 [Capsaspora owczarzaki ATCC 30864]|uniref:Smad nuclear interacting protein 1 n=1 Tax=Capsaspora owczarzaki (strain ATCC 30864) TaxID=595528 RepID=A0A0D2WRA3_CAPO3|nr:smad nuclear interacting protein 1 [Capsaspora owczarzaki ATCC 30864]KJE93693.1 smad nuclear interacting protein 1 [Capsaspora owczarzaki ATCC 30864]|eukprot:XP_004348275.2 smad nuclear interacting protein 1 [Capsaspora owczarzaki ATCC 30864]